MTPRLAALLLLLPACTALVPSTAARLATLDPLTADPAAIEVVVVLPEGLAVSPGSARLELSANRGAQHMSGTFRLADRPAPPDLDLPQGATARGFAVAEADLVRMRALQADIAAWKRAGDAKGALGLGIGGCAVGDGPAPGATGSVLIRLDGDGEYLPLISNGKLETLLGPEVLSAIKPCQGAE
jgi:hypothetical protein